MATPFQAEQRDVLEQLEVLVQEGESKGRPEGSANLGYKKLPNGETVNAENTCVLVVHYGFDNVTNPEDPLIRHGNKEEVESLRKTFYVKRNCNFRDLPSPKKEVLLELLGNAKQLLRMFSLKEDDVPSVFVLFILSHGNEGGIIFTDKGQSFTTAEVFQSMGKLSSFTDCLKFINFGPCRGILDDLVHVCGQSAAQEMKNLNSCSITFSPNMHNLVIFYATVETTSAIRETEKGTWLGQTTCQVLDFLSEDKSLPLYLQTVQFKIHKRSCIHTDVAGKRFPGQTPEVKMFSLDVDFFFSTLPKEIPAVEKPPIPSTSTDAKRGNKESEVGNFLDEDEIYSWKSDTGANIRGCNVFIIYDHCSEHVRQLDNIFSRNPITERSHIILNERGINQYFNEVSKPGPGVGCLMTFLFGKVVEQGPGKEVCLRVGTTELPIRDIIHKSIGPVNTHWVGKPKLFFVLDQDEPQKPQTSSDSNQAPNDLHIQATNHSSWLVLVLKEKDLVGQFIEIFKNEELQKEKCLQELLTAHLHEQKAAGKILLNSTLQYKLHLPNWPRNFVKPVFDVYLPRNCDGTTWQYFWRTLQYFDRLLEKLRESDIQVCLLSSAAGAGKTTLFKELAFEIVKMCPDVKCISSTLGNINAYLMKNPKLSVDKFLAHASHRPEEEIQKFLEENKVIIFFDGFDELRSRNTKIFLRLLKELTRKNITVWISTRPHEASKIQETVKNSAKLEIRPFDYYKKIELLQMLTTKSEKECEEFLDTLIYSIDVLGNALYLTLISQCERTGNLYEIYDQVVRKMIMKYLKKKKNLDITDQDNIAYEINVAFNLHGLAAVRYFSDEDEFQGSDEDVKALNECGIAMVDPERHLRFVHQTFAEFFIAQIFLEDSLLLEEYYGNQQQIFETAIFDHCRVFVDYFYSTLDNDQLKPYADKLLRYYREYPSKVIEIVEGDYINIFKTLKPYITFDECVENGSIYVGNYIEILSAAIERGSADTAIELMKMNVIKNEVQLKSALPKLMYAMDKSNAVYIFEELKVKFPNLLNMINSMEPQIRVDISLWRTTFDPEFLQYLLEEGVHVTVGRVDTESDYFLDYTTVIGDHIDQVRCNFNWFEIAFLEAFYKRKMDIVQYLHEKDPQLVNAINYNTEESLLHRAAWDKNWEMCKWLVEVVGLNLNVLDPRQCSEKCKMGCKPGDWTTNDWMAHDHLMMLRGDVNVKDTRGKTALHCAAEYGHLDLFRKFLDSGADIDAIDNEGKTALHYSKDTHILEELVKRGADDLTIKDHKGWNVMFHAAYDAYRWEQLRYLIENHGYLAKEKATDGRTILHIAATAPLENSTIFYLHYKSLLEYFASQKLVNVNALDNSGLTALHLACIHQDEDYFLRHLLNYFSGEINLSCKTREGLTALQLAEINRKFKLIRLLADSGGLAIGPTGPGPGGHLALWSAFKIGLMGKVYCAAELGRPFAMISPGGPWGSQSATAGRSNIIIKEDELSVQIEELTNCEETSGEKIEQDKNM